MAQSPLITSVECNLDVLIPGMRQLNTSTPLIDSKMCLHVPYHLVCVSFGKIVALQMNI